MQQVAAWPSRPRAEASGISLPGCPPVAWWGGGEGQVVKRFFRPHWSPPEAQSAVDGRIPEGRGRSFSGHTYTLVRHTLLRRGRNEVQGSLRTL